MEEKNATEWTDEEDAICVWMCLSCPFSEFQKQVTSLPGKTPKEIIDRFTTILNDATLVQRVNKKCNGDILAYKPVPWTVLETYSLIRLTHYNKRCVASAFLERFPTLFHPTRTSSSVSSYYDKLKQKDQASIDTQNIHFKEYQDKIYHDVKGQELTPFPGDDDPVATVTAIIKKENDELILREEEAKSLSFDAIMAKVNDAWPKKSFAALVGYGDVRWIKGTNIVFGRASPKCRPDIDLFDLSLQSISRKHCAISLRTDLNFYLECIGGNVIVNGTVFKRGSFVKLRNKDVIDIGGAPFVFIENQTLMDSLRSA
jgi:hypothetical protein